MFSDSAGSVIKRKGIKSKNSKLKYKIQKLSEEKKYFDLLQIQLKVDKPRKPERQTRFR